ncbi:nuclear transport factor 2 family protein [Rhizobium sp. SG_E_25_P2]|jgi:steroid delta-isomerase-like uncharacterized protein|uniref:ester cyclase n=1 Tax=Rhizobium sp. SG_E_25_P2 TaxID=2879942 RepID=UPI002474A01B|nr:nuclear transport factor 2 family protein [Rhizobium sp. SG_E_25_P2]
MLSHDQLIDQFYDCYNRHDASAAIALYASDGRHVEMAMGKTRAGADALQAGLEGFFKMMPDVVWRERERVRSAGRVAVVYTMTGHVAPRSSDAAAKPVALPGLHVFTIENGQIIETQDLWDKAEFLAQIA